MAQATFTFPRGFLWGAATAAHQVEGNNTNNNWWAWEQQPGRILNGQKSGLACDWWGGRWREDFDRAAETHQNTHRLSVEWSRIQPTPDRWDEAALDRYRDMLRGLHQRNILPMVTLHHFSDPLWLSELGGWETEAAAERFEKFVRKTVEALQEYTSLWVTINEPNVVSTSGYVMGDFPPGKRDIGAAFRVMHNLVLGHARAYHAIHELQPAARVGIAHHYRGFIPHRSWLPLDGFAAGMQDRFFNDFFARAAATGVLRYPAWTQRLPQAKGTQDFFGLNYYTCDHVSFNLLYASNMFGRRFYRADAELSATGFLANEPEGIFRALQWARGYQLPILITENGVEDPDDSLRPRYLIEHLHQVWRAINFNYPIKAYYHWSLVDNFEWERGWSQRFGLWEVDPETQARRKRPSADLYAEICDSNSLSSDMVARYAPSLIEKLFPD